MSITKLLALCALFAANAHASVAYQNATNDLFAGLNFQANDLVEAGDQVTLIPGSHLLTGVAIDVFNSDVDVIIDVTLRLYQVNGTTLGSLIAPLTLQNVSFASFDVTKLQFAFNQLAIPNDLVWTLEFSDSLGMELNLFNPPSIGSSNPTTAWFRGTFGVLALDTFDPGPDGFYERNFNATFVVADSQTSSVPEPSAALLTGAVLLLVWRKK